MTVQLIPTWQTCLFLFDRTLKFASSIWMRKKNIGKSEPQNQSDYFPRNSFRKHYPSKKKIHYYPYSSEKKNLLLPVGLVQVGSQQGPLVFPPRCSGAISFTLGKFDQAMFGKSWCSWKAIFGPSTEQIRWWKTHSFRGSQKIPKKVKIWTNSQSTSSLWSGRCV